MSEETILYRKKGKRYYPVTEEFLGFPEEGYWKVKRDYQANQRFSTKLLPLETPRPLEQMRFLQYQEEISTHLLKKYEEELMSLNEIVVQMLLKLEDLVYQKTEFDLEEE